MENVILSTSRMRAITGNRFNSPHTIARVQARHLLRILKERYTCGVKGDLANGWIMISPDELAEMEKEIEG